MKIGTKTVLTLGTAMLALGVTILVAGSITIRSIIGEMSAASFALELTSALNIAESAHKTLVETGTASAENYVKEAQKEVLEGLRARKNTSGGELAIVGSDGKVLLHPTLSVGSEVREDFLKTMLERKTGSLRYAFSGQNKFGAFHFFEPWNWLLVYTAPESVLYAAANRFALIMSGLVLVGALASIGGSLVVLRRDVILPLQDLTSLAAKVAAGELPEWRFGHRLANEVGELARAFESVVGSNRKKAEVVREIASGTLTVEVPEESRGDVLAGDLRLMLGSVRETLSAAREAADSVTKGTREIATAASNLSNNATCQASAIEEISASMTELASQSQRYAEQAREGSELGNRMQGMATTGQTEMEHLVTAMNRLGDSARETRKIIKLIDEIAFQTNLLALNASVESARAGKHGKGFAVVADEVRNLAGRSASAVHETRSRVEETLREVGNGEALVKSTSIRFQEILAAAAQIGTMMNAVAESSSHSSHAISEIRSSLSQIENVVQANTSNAEQTAAATLELGAIAKRLEDLIAHFHLA